MKKITIISVLVSLSATCSGSDLLPRIPAVSKSPLVHTAPLSLKYSGTTSLQMHQNMVDAVKTRAAEPVKADGAKAAPVLQMKPQGELRQMALDSKSQRLDSVVCRLHSTGENVSLQTFTFDPNGYPSERVNSLWDKVSGMWTPVEYYGYKWDKDGYCLSQWGYSDTYNSGQRYDYTYNDQKLGDSQIIYSYIDGEWVPMSKGTYKYDEYGNLVEEYTYSYSGSDWIPLNHNIVAFDSEGHQTLYESYYWNGTGWEANGDKQEYVWNRSGYVTLYNSYMWQPDTRTWINYYRVEQSFNDDNKITLQETKFWNRTLQSWDGVEDWGYGTCWNLRTDFTYDSKGRQDEERAYTSYEAGKYTPTCDMIYSYTPIDEGGTELYCETYMYDGNGGNRYLEGKLTKRYDASDHLTYAIESKLENGKFITYYDENYVYDEKGNLTGSYSYTYTRDEENKRLADISEELVYDNAGNVIDSYYKNGQGTGDDDWINVSRFTYTYENDTVRTDKKAYLWNGSDFVPNWGEGARYDYTVPVDEILTWPAGAAYHKILETMSYSADASGGWDWNSFEYFYSDLSATGISSPSADGKSETVSRVVDDRLEISVDGKAKVRIYNAAGSLVQSTSEKSVYIGNFAPGIYIVDVNGSRAKIMKR